MKMDGPARRPGEARRLFLRGRAARQAPQAPQPRAVIRMSLHKDCPVFQYRPAPAAGCTACVAAAPYLGSAAIAMGALSLVLQAWRLDERWCGATILCVVPAVLCALCDGPLDNIMQGLCIGIDACTFILLVLVACQRANDHKQPRQKRTAAHTAGGAAPLLVIDPE